MNSSFLKSLALVAVVSAAQAHAEIRPVRAYQIFEVQTAQATPGEAIQIEALTGDLIKVVVTAPLTRNPVQIDVKSDDHTVVFPIADTNLMKEFGDDSRRIPVGVQGKVFYFKVMTAGRANLQINKASITGTETQSIEVKAGHRYMTMD